MMWLGCFLPLAYLLPNHYSPWLSFHQEMMAGIAFLPLLIISFFDSTRFKHPLILMAVFFFVALPFVQFIFGKILYFSDAFVVALYLLGLALAFFAGGRLSFKADDFESSEKLSPLFFAFLISSVVSVFIQMHQWLGLDWSGVFVIDLKPGGRPYANLAQPNQLATLLLLGQLSLIYLYELRRSSAIFVLFLSALLSVGLALTQSRTALIAGILISLSWLLCRKKMKARISAMGVLIPFLFFLSAFFGLAGINKVLLLGAGQSSLVDRFGSDLRLEMWRQMIDAIGRSPWFGYGWNQVSIAQQAVAMDHRALHIYLESAHNIFIDLMLWVGIPIALLVFFFVLVGIRRGIELTKSPVQLIFLLAAATILFHALFEYPMSYLYFLLPVGLIAGVLLGGGRESATSGFVWLSVLVRSLFLGLSLLIGWGGFLLVPEYFKWERSWRDLQYQTARIGVEKEIPLPPTQILTGFLEAAEVVKMEPVKNLPPEVIEKTRKISERYGWGNLLFKYALVSGLNEMPVESRRALGLICKVSSGKYCEKARFDWERWRTIYPVLSSFDDANLGR